MLKRCPRCNTEKETSEFAKLKAAKDGLNWYCRECARAICKSYREGKYVKLEKGDKQFRIVSEKHCPKCKTTKSISDFPKLKSSLDGYHTYCSDCNKASNRAYREKHSERYYANQTAVRNSLNGRLRECLHNAKTRSKQKGFDFNLTEQDLHDLWISGKGKCAITGCDMSLESGPRKKANPSRVSIDRKDSTKGYTKENIQLVCWVVNQMKGDRTNEEFKFWIETLYLAFRQSAAKPSVDGRFNDYPEREYASSEAEAPSPVING